MINEQVFLEKFKEQFLDAEDASIQLETKFRETNDWDSLTGMSILVMIEDEYSVTVTPDELKKCELVSDIILLVNNKVNA
jgi:acyl carrier protein